jgi:hypothetical protein
VRLPTRRRHTLNGSGDAFKAIRYGQQRRTLLAKASEAKGPARLARGEPPSITDRRLRFRQMRNER